MDEKKALYRRELGLFEAVAERAAAGELGPGDEFSGRAAAEFLRRVKLRDAWVADALSGISGPRPRRMDIRSLPLWGSALVVVVCGELVVYTGSWWMALPGAIGLLVAVVEVLDRRWKGRALRVVNRECVACGYPLGEIPDGVPPEVIGVRVGPRRCPECGSPWPCVPAVNGNAGSGWWG